MGKEEKEKQAGRKSLKKTAAYLRKGPKKKGTHAADLRIHSTGGGGKHGES